VKRTKLFRQPSGSDEGADDDHATGQPQTAQGGLDPIASRSAADGLRGRAFLSEHANDNRFRYYKGGLVKHNPPIIKLLRNTLRHYALRVY
jgi:hypothetical protein